MKDTPFSLIAVFVDAEHSFKGNTAATILLNVAITDQEMQEIAADFNQPATIFLWPDQQSDAFHVRWMAPDAEIDLCGHGSLAAFAFLSKLKSSEKFTLLYRNGKIEGKMDGDGACMIYMDAIPVLSEMAVPELLPKALGIPVKACYATSGKLIVLSDQEKSIRDMSPDYAMLRQLETFGYAITAPGDHVDFVSRTLVPHVKQLEDPATGSSHAALVPFWADKLNKTHLLAHQLSPRGGKFICGIDQEIVSLRGEFKVIGEGELR